MTDMVDTCKDPLLMVKEYLKAKITNDCIHAEIAWMALSGSIKNILNEHLLGLRNYLGNHIEAPIGSTWKAHKSLELKVQELVDRYIDFMGA